MWVTGKLLDLFHISKDTVDGLRAELAAIRTDRDALRVQLTTLQNNFDWIRMQINTLQIERTALMDKAYGIKIPTPEIIRTPIRTEDDKVDEFTFEDIGEVMAKKLGYSTYAEK